MKISLLPVGLLLGLLTLAGCATGTNRPHNYARWEKAIHAFELQDVRRAPPTNAIVFTGSSTIARWKTLAKDFPGLPVVNRGFGGSQIVDAAHFAGRMIFPCQPRMILLRAGGNDLWSGKSPEEVAGDFKDFAETVHAKLPGTKIVYLSLSPSPLRWRQHEQEKQLNNLVGAYIAGKSWLQYVETYDLPLGTNGLPRPELFVSDRLHFNAAGYKLLAGRVRPCLPK
ncbi:MAG: GDSL-type esterase/lipase family protein [Verrucomicrobiota bacterium]